MARVGSKAHRRLMTVKTLVLAGVPTKEIAKRVGMAEKSVRLNITKKLNYELTGQYLDRSKLLKVQDMTQYKNIEVARGTWLAVPKDYTKKQIQEEKDKFYKNHENSSLKERIDKFKNKIIQT